MLQTIWHHFSVQLSLLFQVLCSILLAVFPFKTPTADWWKISTANQDSPKEWFKSATQRAKQSTPSETVKKTELKSDVRLFVAFSMTYFIVWQVVMPVDPYLGKALRRARSKQRDYHLHWEAWRTLLNIPQVKTKSDLRIKPSWQNFRCNHHFVMWTWLGLVFVSLQLIRANK